jgi:hypothetical protein
VSLEVLPLTPEIVIDAMRLPAFPSRDLADERIVAIPHVCIASSC